MGIWLMHRAGRLDDNPQTRAIRAQAFVAATRGLRGVSLFAARTESGVVNFMSARPSNASGDPAAFKLADAVAARPEPVDEVPVELTAATHVGYLRADEGVFRSAQMGVDDAELPRILSQSIPPESWVGVGYREPDRKERKRHMKWLSGRNGVPGAAVRVTSPQAVVVSVWAGGDDADSVRGLLDVTAAAMPGFDVGVKPVVLSRRSAWVGLPLVAMLVVAVLGVGLSMVTIPETPYVPPMVFDLLRLAVLAGAGVAAVVWVLRGLLVLPSPWTRVVRALGDDVLPEPLHRAGKPKAPTKERRTSDGDLIEATEGDYPLHVSSFLLDPQVFVGVGSPQSGAASGAESTATRAYPGVLLDRVGPLICEGATGQRIWLPADHGFHGVACTGRPGSGKTKFISGLWGWAMLERARPDATLPGAPGGNQSLVWFESKDSFGAAEQVEWGRLAGVAVGCIELGGSNGPVIDMLGGPEPVGVRASRFAGAMQDAFPPGDIQARSREALTTVFHAALLIPEQMLTIVPGCEQGSEITTSRRFSTVEIAYILLGGRGDRMGVELAGVVAAEATRLLSANPSDEFGLRLDQARRILAPYYTGRTEAKRREILDPPKSKVGELLDVPDWWCPSRQQKRWADVLRNHDAVVVNLGTSSPTAMHPEGRAVMEQTKARVGSMLMAQLQEAIESTCAGWRDQHRVVGIYADELKMLAEHTPSRVEWMRNQGRSYGVRLHLATQYPDQLPPTLRTAFFSFGTLVSYVQADVATAEQTAKQVSGGSTEWGAQDVLHLEPWHAIVRTTHLDRLQPAFVAKVLNFEALRETFAAMQGYEVQPLLVSAPAMTPAPVYDGAVDRRDGSTQPVPDGSVPQADDDVYDTLSAADLDLARELAATSTDDGWDEPEEWSTPEPVAQPVEPIQPAPQADPQYPSAPASDDSWEW